MLSRGNSSVSTRLRRAKSSSSVQTRHHLPFDPGSIDAETARQHALTAASIAFDRAQERSSALREVEYDTSGREITRHPDQKVGRKQSVRFTGPSAVPMRQRSITRREASAYATSSMLTPQIQRRSSSIGGTESFFTAIRHPGEHYIDDGVSSTPSSYRRIRKSKSMYSPRKAPSIVFTNGTPPIKARHPISNDEQLSGRPDLRRSASFLRGGTEYILRSSHQIVNRDAAIKMARDQYLRQLEEQRVKGRPSFLHPVERRKSQKAFRRTVRTSSTNSYGSAISSSNQLAAKPATSQGLGRKARELSMSLKDKLKKVFRRSSQVEESIPTQQLDATRAHFRDYMPATSSVYQDYKSVSPPNDSIIRRVNSRTSSLGSAAVQPDKGHLAGSIRSVRSDDSISNGRSRVTSWTNSTAANTMTTREIVMDKKRLSIIQENGGPHQSLSMAHPYGTPTDGRYAVFRKPLRNNSGVGRVTGPVDSHRVYSALMRRLEENAPAARRADADYLMGIDHGETNYQLSATSLRTTSGNTERTPANTREVSNPSEESLSSVRGIKVLKSVNALPGDRADHVFSDEDSAKARRGLGNTPPDLAERIERVNTQHRGPLREIRSSFFPPSTRIESLKTSPYRRALQAGSEDRKGPEGETRDISTRSIGTVPHFNIGHQLSHRGSTIGSGSIYSQTTSGNTPQPMDSYVSLIGSENGGEPGTAVIITNRTARFNVATAPAACTGKTSARSSNEWKTWMASQVAGLENQNPDRVNICADYAVKENGHKREYTQIDGDDVEVGARRCPDLIAKQPLAAIHGNITNRPVLRTKKSDQILERFSVLEVGSPPDSNTAEWAVQRSRTLSRRLSNIENERFPSAPGYRRPSVVRSKTSQTSLRSQGSYTAPVRAQLYATASARERLHAKSTSSLHSRQSPERAARLRRMQSAAAGLKEAADRQFGSVQSQQRQHGPENQAIHSGSTATLEREELYDMYGTGLTGSRRSESPRMVAIGMVDAFLNRRRDVTGISERSEGAGAVFL